MESGIHHQAYLGFTSLESERAPISLDVEGSLPQWLTGSLLCIGPAKFEAGKKQVSHLLDGLGMLHAFTFGKNKIDYSHAFLKSDAYKKVKQQGALSYTGFAQDPESTFFKRFVSTFLPYSGTNEIKNATFNIARIGNAYAVLAPQSAPICFNPDTLETIGTLDLLDNKLDYGGYENPYPQYDEKRKELISYFVTFGDPNTYHIYTMKDGSETRHKVAQFTTQELYYAQNLSVTDNYIIITLCPLVSNSAHITMKNKPFIKNFNWKPQLGTTFMVIERHTGKIIEKFLSTPFFAFHQINAFEQNGALILDMISYPDTIFIDYFYWNNLQNPTYQFSSGYLTRYTLPISDDKQMVWSQIISKEQLDLPAINLNTYGKNYQYVYGAEFNPHTKNAYNSLVKIDLKTHQSQRWFKAHCYPSKPIFIPNPQAETEDDGVLVSVVLNTKKKNSFLLFLDGKTFTEYGRIQLPHHIPFGLQGIYKK